MFADFGRRNFAFLRAGFEQSPGKKNLRFQVRHSFDRTTLYTCPSRKEVFQGPQGKVCEKDIFENTRLAISVRRSSHFCVRYGSTERYRFGQYSFTNFMAALSESENPSVAEKAENHMEECRCVKRQINRVLHYVTGGLRHRYQSFPSSNYINELLK